MEIKLLQSKRYAFQLDIDIGTESRVYVHAEHLSFPLRSNQGRVEAINELSHLRLMLAALPFRVLHEANLSV